MKVNNASILASLLSWAYHAEGDEEDAIYYALIDIPPGDDWDSLMKIMRDNEVHKTMLEEAIAILGHKIYKREPRKFDFSGFDRNRILESIAKWEKFAYYYYLYLYRNTEFDNLELEAESIEKLKDIIDSLIKWEKKHIEIVNKLLENFGVRYRII